MFKNIFYVLFAICYIHYASALYFHIGETERKCFIEEIPDETTVIGMKISGLLKQFLFLLIFLHFLQLIIR